VVLKVEATDLAAMRAALNSYLRWMQIAEEMSITSGE
jgi:tRNA threonylcarbamoyladenosine modification (KEOPS) complex  Pcc1 subunit